MPYNPGSALLSKPPGIAVPAIVASSSPLPGGGVTVTVTGGGAQERHCLVRLCFCGIYRSRPQPSYGITLMSLRDSGLAIGWIGYTKSSTSGSKIVILVLLHHGHVRRSPSERLSQDVAGDERLRADVPRPCQLPSAPSSPQILPLSPVPFSPLPGSVSPRLSPPLSTLFLAPSPAASLPPPLPIVSFPPPAHDFCSGMSACSAERSSMRMQSSLTVARLRARAGMLASR